MSVKRNFGQPLPHHRLVVYWLVLGGFPLLVLLFVKKTDFGNPERLPTIIGLSIWVLSASAVDVDRALEAPMILGIAGEI